jgi:hypothetical protein
MKHEWTVQRIGVGVWAAVFAALLVALAYPISIGIVRLFIVTAAPVLWVAAILLARRKKAVAATIALAGLLVLGFAAFPGRTPEPGRLRQAYVDELRTYEGSRYVWGGENRRGIDCSGLVRRALINAHMRLAVVTLNSRALRTALDLWWHDCSAQALGEQYRGFTVAVFKASSANAAEEPALHPGDIGVTASGVHVLAYLGDREWIQAEPVLLKVVTLRVPSKNGWMNQPLNIMRWTMMAEAANQAAEVTARKLAEPHR